MTNKIMMRFTLIKKYKIYKTKKKKLFIKKKKEFAQPAI